MKVPGLSFSCLLCVLLMASCLSRSTPRSATTETQATEEGTDPVAARAPLPSEDSSHPGPSQPPSNLKPQAAPGQSAPTLATAKALETGGKGIHRTYKDVKEIFDEHCVGCHGPGQDPVLNSYPFDSLFSANQRDLMNRIIQSIKNQRMPPKERPALPPESLARLVDWLNSGLPAE